MNNDSPSGGVIIVTRECTVGDEVEWHHVPRGGYGYSVRVPAVIRAIGKKRVAIDAQRKDGTWVRRHVDGATLQWNGGGNVARP